MPGKQQWLALAEWKLLIVFQPGTFRCANEHSNGMVQRPTDNQFATVSQYLQGSLFQDPKSMYSQAPCRKWNMVSSCNPRVFPLF